MDQALTLAIETSNPGTGPGEVALARVGGGEVDVLALERLAPEGRHDDALMPAMERLVRAAGVAPRDVGRVAVSVGPGGYSSVRIACAAGQMIALATGARAVAVPSAESAARSSPALGRVGVALAGKRDAAWVAVFDADASPPIGPMVEIGAGETVDADGLTRLRERAGLRTLLADKHLPEAMRVRCGELGIDVEPLALTARGCLLASIGREPVDAAALLPVYPREPEAVRKWRSLGRA